MTGTLKYLLLLIVAFATSVTSAAGSPQATTGVTLAGQVVCSECWFEQDDRRANPYGTAADMKCAVRCSKDSIPQALAVWDGPVATIYVLERGRYETSSKDFLDLVGKSVEISGPARAEAGKHFIRVDSLTVTAATTVAPAVPQTAAEIGQPAPHLSLPDLSGQEQSLAGYRGRIVVLNFWATWCAPCRKEMPIFVNLQAEYAAWGVQVVAASADTPDAMEKVVAFVREKRLTFPVWTGASSDDMLGFGLTSALPGTVIIDRDGTIAARFAGVVTEAQLRKEIDGLLAKQRAASGRAALDPASSRKSSVPA